MQEDVRFAVGIDAKLPVTVDAPWCGCGQFRTESSLLALTDVIDLNQLRLDLLGRAKPCRAGFREVIQVVTIAGRRGFLKVDQRLAVCDA